MAIVSLGPGQPGLSFRLRDCQVLAVRIPAGLVCEVSWEVSDSSSGSSTIRIRKGGESESHSLVDVIVVSRDQRIAFADNERFEKIAEMDSLRGAVDVVTEQMIKDLTEEEKGGGPSATDNPGGAQRN